MSIKKVLSLLFSFTFLVALSFGQNCTGDSVVVTKRYQYVPGETYFIITDTFNIVSGINKSSERGIIPSTAEQAPVTHIRKKLFLLMTL